jgi:hypothetical protein
LSTKIMILLDLNNKSRILGKKVGN